MSKERDEMKRRVDAAYMKVLSVSADNNTLNNQQVLATLVYNQAVHETTLNFTVISIDTPPGYFKYGTSKCPYNPDRQMDYRETAIRILSTFPDAYVIQGSQPTLWTPSFCINLGNLTGYSIFPFIQKDLLDCIVYKENAPSMQYVTRGTNGFTSHYMPLKEQICDISTNYNDDLPHSKIVNFLKSEESGIVILHGVPGCGKTSYIRHAIASCKELSFVFLDSSTFNYIGDSAFIDFLLSRKESVFVIEDCEDLLADRDSKGNYKIAALLNLSDGILGDSLKLKFICTFNADINSIDKALLRKGRLKVKYEFKELTSDKVLLLANKLGKPIESIAPMPLCEVYNLNEVTGGETAIKPRPKIGF